jgi:hypothetical protein
MAWAGVAIANPSAAKPNSVAERKIILTSSNLVCIPAVAESLLNALHFVALGFLLIDF